MVSTVQYRVVTVVSTVQGGDCGQYSTRWSVQYRVVTVVSTVQGGDCGQYSTGW